MGHDAEPSGSTPSRGNAPCHDRAGVGCRPTSRDIEIQDDRGSAAKCASGLYKLDFALSALAASAILDDAIGVAISLLVAATRHARDERSRSCAGGAGAAATLAGVYDLGLWRRGYGGHCAGAWC